MTRKLNFLKTSNIVAFCRNLGATKVELCQNKGISERTGKAKKPFFSIPEAGIVGTVSARVGSELSRDLMISVCVDPNDEEAVEFYLLHPAGKRPENKLDELTV